jgi:hypothetical protein
MADINTRSGVAILRSDESLIWIQRPEVDQSLVSHYQTSGTDWALKVILAERKRLSASCKPDCAKGCIQDEIGGQVCNPSLSAPGRCGSDILPHSRHRIFRKTLNLPPLTGLFVLS